MAKEKVEEVKEVKPGYKTSEFWLTVAAFVVSAVFGSGILGDDGIDLQAAEVIALILGSLGYTVSRTIGKVKS